MSRHKISPDMQALRVLLPRWLETNILRISSCFFPGSASFYEIPVLDGMPVLLVGKKSTTFTWGPANMYPVLHEALTSRVDIVRELAPDEVDAWSQRLRQHKGNQ